MGRADRGAARRGRRHPPNPAPEPVEPWDDGNAHLTQAWRAETRDVVVAQPLVRDGVVFSGSRDVAGPVIGGLVPATVRGIDAVLVPGTDGRLRALAAVDGRTLWSRDLGDQILAAPTVDGDAVYAGTIGGTVSRLNSADGAQEWKVDVPSRVLRSVGVATGEGQPGHVLVGLIPYGDCQEGGFSGYLALDADSGER